MQLAWSDAVVRHTGRRVLILTPLAVSHQTVTEAVKFGIDADRSQSGPKDAPITVTNYERLEMFSPDDFAGVVCDESSILKCYDGKRRAAITAFLRTVPYRLLCSATAAPNDHIELGNSSQALGYLGHVDMLSRFFVNDELTVSQRRIAGNAKEWRFKGHAEDRFWQWVCTWARALRAPSDLGYEDGAFILPDLIEREHELDIATCQPGELFARPATTLTEQRAERRRTITERCEKVAALVDDGQPALVWCDLNDEGDLLERLIPGAVQVSGKDTDAAKEERLIGFAQGEYRVLITKPKIGAWGLNFQRCAHVTFFPSHSYEQTYQGIRRCWRFGQMRPVVVDTVTTPGSHTVLVNVRRKATRAVEMFAALVGHMREAQGLARVETFHKTEEIPQWLSPTST